MDLTNLKNSKIYFCFPYHAVGGVSVLFLRMAKALADRLDTDIFIIDYHDGYMARTNTHKRVKLLEYRDDEKVIIPNEAIVVFQSMTPWSIFPSLEIPDSAKLFFWNCYPYNLIPTMPGIRKQMYSSILLSQVLLKTILVSYASKMRTFLKILEKNKGIAFMDRTNIEITENCLGVKVKNRRYLPVPIDYCGLDINLSNQNLKEEIRAAWVGRVADFKVHILLYTILKLGKLAREQRKKIIFSVIGSGEFLDYLKCSSQENEYFKLDFLGDKSTEELKSFLKNDCDLLFAMGTSALEGASLGVPTVLLDIAYSKIEKDYLFRFLFEETGCVLGDVLSNKSFKTGNQSLQKIFFEVQNNFEQISKKSFEYTRTFHSIDSVSDNLIDCLSSNELTFLELKKAKIFSPSYLYRIFRSVRKKLA